MGPPSAKSASLTSRRLATEVGEWLPRTDLRRVGVGPKVSVSPGKTKLATSAPGTRLVWEVASTYPCHVSATNLLPLHSGGLAWIRVVACDLITTALSVEPNASLDFTQLQHARRILAGLKSAR